MTEEHDSLELLNDIENGRDKENKFDYRDVDLIINQSDEEEHLHPDHFIHNAILEQDDRNSDAIEQEANDPLNNEEGSKEILEAIQEAEEDADEKDVDEKHTNEEDGDKEDADEEDVNGEDADEKPKCIIKESDESIEIIKKDFIEDKIIISRLSKLDERLTRIGRLKEVIEEEKNLRMKNGFLQKKYSECLKKNKKYDGFEKVIDPGIRNRESYEEILEEYMEIKVDVEKRKPGYETEISKMEESYKNQENEFNTKFKELLLRESEIGNNVINSKTGKAFGDREVDSMIERQKSRASELADTRFTYLKRRNILNHLLSKLYELDNLGIGYTTIEYEQMVIERQGVLEKLDEREEEIRRIRDKCFTYVAVLSHIKESIASITRDIQETSVVLSKYSDIQNYGRYATMKRKLERDITRKHNIQLRESSGLLAHPDLLSKMETDILQLQFFKEKIEWLQAEVYLQHTQTDRIKAFLKRQRNHSQSPLESY